MQTQGRPPKRTRRASHVAFQAAQKRGKKLTSVDKANVLETSQFWKDIMIDVSKEYADVELSHMYVDNAAMQLVKAPKSFDVIVTGNMFGDILSDEAAMLTGSIGTTFDARSSTALPPLHARRVPRARTKQPVKAACKANEQNCGKAITSRHPFRQIMQHTDVESPQPSESHCDIPLSYHAARSARP